jgi:hypothetical protein
LLSILRDDLLPNEITVDGVNADGLWLKDRNGVRLSWREMSDGYRSSLALLADIVRHMIKVHGAEELLGKTPDGHVFVRKSGVILIDEVDAHPTRSGSGRSASGSGATSRKCSSS